MLMNILFLVLIGATLISPSLSTFSGMASPFAMLLSKITGTGGSQEGCCRQQYEGGGRLMEAFDDGTPLEFYRRQVAMQNGGGGGRGYNNNGKGGNYKMGGNKGTNLNYNMAYNMNGGGGASGGHQMAGGINFPKKTVPNGPYGPFGPQTSRKWRGFGKAIKNRGGYGGQDVKLSNVRLVKSEVKADMYNDNTLTMIADTIKGGGDGGGGKY